MNKIKQNFLNNYFQKAKCYIKLFGETKKFAILNYSSLERTIAVAVIDIAFIHIDCNNISFRNPENINTTKLAESIISVAKIMKYLK